jgi:hypothetical protein
MNIDTTIKHKNQMNNENEIIRSLASKAINELQARDPVTKSGIEFLAGRAGQTIEEYAMDALLQRLASDEIDEIEKYSHFGRLRREVA